MLYRYFTFLFFAFVWTSSSLATLVGMQELFNNELKHTVILGSDCHLSGDKGQVSDCMELIKKYKALPIVEGGLLDDSGKPQIDTMLLGALIKKLAKEDINTFLPEFREGYIYLARVMLKSLGKNYKEIEELWHTLAIKNTVYHGWFLARENAEKALQGVKDSIFELRDAQVISADAIEVLAIELDCLGQLYNTLRTITRSVISQEFISADADRDAIVPFIFKDVFSENGDGTSHLNNDSVFEKMHHLQCQLFDMRIIMHILKNKDQKISAVFAGAEHTRNISLILSKIGFESKTHDEEDKNAVKIYWQERERAEPEFMTSEAARDYETLRHLLKLNIKEFLALCKTLPQ